MISTHDDAQYVNLTIRDNGIGIAADSQENIFEPFVSKRKVGQGSGLGLHTVYNTIVHQYKGVVLLESEPDKFTEFTIRIPRTRD